MKIMALDIGKTRTGVAMSDLSESLASPVGIIESYQMEKLIVGVIKMVEQYNIEKIIVGLPIKADGQVGEMGEMINEFVRLLKLRIEIEIEFLNEAYTTVIAVKKLHENKKNSKKQKSLIDAAAAAVLLQDYLDTMKNKRITE